MRDPSRDPMPLSDDAFRAIGRYVVGFSILIHNMRDMVSEYVAGGADRAHLVTVLLGESTAQPIANAFFGVCRTVGELDGNEQVVWRVLRNEVDETIRMRNDIAHGDRWFGGSLSGPSLIRIAPMRRPSPFKRQDLSIEEMNVLSDETFELQTRINELGRLALKLPMFNFASDVARPSASANLESATS